MSHKYSGGLKLGLRAHGYLCFTCAFIMLYYLFLAVLLSPAGKGLTSCLSVCDVFLCFVTFQNGVSGQEWYFIVSIPDLCLRPYLFYKLKS